MFESYLLGGGGAGDTVWSHMAGAALQCSSYNVCVLTVVLPAASKLCQ